MLRDHQQALAAEVLADLEAKTPEVLLAACPGFGKTEVALWLIGQLITKKLIKSVLVLAHATTVLRENFLDRLKRRRPDLLPFVCVALPQDWRKLRNVEYPLVVVDEAHQFYEAGEAGMVGRILKQVRAKQCLLLSGSPARFIRRELKPHAFALDELFQVDGAKWVSDIRVDLALSAYEIRERDWNATGEVRDRVRYKQSQTDKTLDRLMTSLGPRLRVGKEATLIACKSIKMADQVDAFFDRRGIKCEVSHSKGDEDSTAVAAFRAGEIKLLVVVARATLGFDYPGLRNFIDLTGSRNPDRIFQMMCRLTRPTEGKPAKTYVKVMPKAFSGRDLRLFMTGVCALKYRELYTTWDGGSFYKLRVPVDKSGEPRPAETDTGKRKRPGFESAMMLFGDGFKEVRDESGRLATKGLWEISERRRPQAPGESKRAVIDFFHVHGRWPNRYTAGAISEERLLADRLRAYISRSSSSYDEQFETEVRRLGWCRKESPSERKARILQFYRVHGRLPSPRSRHDEERLIGGNARGYLAVSSPVYDAILERELAKMGWRKLGAVMVAIRGQRHNLTEAARIYKVKKQTLHNRYHRGLRGEALIAQVPREPSRSQQK